MAGLNSVALPCCCFRNACISSALLHGGRIALAAALQVGPLYRAQCAHSSAGNVLNPVAFVHSLLLSSVLCGNKFATCELRFCNAWHVFPQFNVFLALFLDSCSSLPGQELPDPPVAKFAESFAHFLVPCMPYDRCDKSAT